VHFTVLDTNKVAINCRPFFAGQGLQFGTDVTEWVKNAACQESQRIGFFTLSYQLKKEEEPVAIKM
jgi:hypothetical protein